MEVLRKEEKGRNFKTLVRFKLHCEFVKYSHFYCGCWEPGRTEERERARGWGQGAGLAGRMLFLSVRTGHPETLF